MYRNISLWILPNSPVLRVKHSESTYSVLEEILLEDIYSSTKTAFTETGDARLSASAKILSLCMFEELFDPEINADNKPRQIQVSGIGHR